MTDKVYKSVDEWLNEIENFSTRYERMLDDIGPKAIPWIEVAWKLGECAGMARVIEQIEPRVERLVESDKAIRKKLNEET